jgi:hypothetical protein
MGPSEGLVPCRVCWARIRLQQDRVDIVDARVYYRCQNCGGSMLIRYEDAVDMRVLDVNGRPKPTQADPGSAAVQEGLRRREG